MNENSTTLKKTNKKSENGKLKQSLNFDDFDIQIESLLKKNTLEFKSYPDQFFLRLVKKFLSVVKLVLFYSLTLIFLS